MRSFRCRSPSAHRRRRPRAAAAAVKTAVQAIEFKVDEGPRADTTLEALAALKPAFHLKGTVTAGNSSQMSDGAAAAVVMSAERAEGARTQASGALCRLRHGRLQAGGDGTRPGVCDSQGAETSRLTLDQIGIIELNEAFAAQALRSSRKPDSIPRRSTPTAEPSRSAIPWAAPARSLRRLCYANSSAASNGMESSPCVSAAAWELPESSKISINVNL